MSYTQNRARRGPPPAPFHENLRRHVDGLGMPQPAIADALGVSLRTIECWLAGPDHSWGRVPHRLMQVGALQLLSMRLAHMKSGGKSFRWEITTTDGVVHIAPELTEWIRKNFPLENAVNVATGLRLRGRHIKTGLVAKKIIYKVEQQ